jgi:predicted enzyme related to lactoylglutathione lyase
MARDTRQLVAAVAGCLTLPLLRAESRQPRPRLAYSNFSAPLVSALHDENDHDVQPGWQPNELLPDPEPGCTHCSIVEGGPPLPPDTDEQGGWLSDRWLSPGAGTARGTIASRDLPVRRARHTTSRFTAMSSPIQRSIGQVFIPVRDMSRAVGWYAELLGFEPQETSHEGTIFDIPTDGDTRLALDANRPDFETSGPPRFFFWTRDMAATVAHLQHLGVKLTSEVEDIGSVFFVQFEDPDGNPLMVCQRA